MNGSSQGLVLRVQQGGRLTIPNKHLRSLGIEDGEIVIVSIAKAIIKVAGEERER